MTSVISNLTKQVLDRAIVEIKKEDNIQKIKVEIINPLIEYSLVRIYPYIIITAALFILTFLIALIILIVLLRK
jgi:hypothetical protein